VVVTYGILLRLLGLELSMRPIIADVARDLPDGARIETGGLPLRWKLLGGLPAINVITGVVVAGLSSHGTATLRDLGVDVLVAVAVAFTVSLELTLLLSRSILLPLEQLRDATVRIGQGDFSARVPVMANDETGVLSEAFNQAAAGLEERERLRDAFGVYLDPTVAEHVMREDGAAQHGQEREVTVLFVDIRGFTAFAERASPREVVRRLNEFYELVVPILQRHGGHVDSFIGDGLLGVFGAPDRLPDHADRALAAALEMVGSVRARYRDMLRIGIGVNTGRVVAGTIGGGGRLEFTVIGDVVNTASRVEALTRDTGDDILITAATRARLMREPVTLEERPLAELAGRAEPVGLFAARELEVAPPAGDLVTDLSETVVELAD